MLFNVTKISSPPCFWGLPVSSCLKQHGCTLIDVIETRNFDHWESNLRKFSCHDHRTHWRSLFNMFFTGRKCTSRKSDNQHLLIRRIIHHNQSSGFHYRSFFTIFDPFSGHWLKHCGCNPWETSWNLNVARNYTLMKTGKNFETVLNRLKSSHSNNLRVHNAKEIERSFGVCSKHLAEKVFVKCKSIESV